MTSALVRAVEEFAEYAPEAASHAAVVEAALAAARSAASDLEAGGRVTYARVPVAERDRLPLLRSVCVLVERLRGEADLEMWWWMEKGDADGRHLRVRLHAPEAIPLEGLRELAAHGEVRLLPYEPEVALFGGEVGIRIAHRFHHADSELLADVLCDVATTGRGPHGLTLRVMETVMRAAGLDPFERWDMWRLASRQRPLALEAEAIVAKDREAVEWVRDVLARSEDAVAGGEGMLAPFAEVGRDLAAAHRRGLLERAPRKVIAAMFVFHGNRARLSYAAQARLARAAAAACDPMPAEARPSDAAHRDPPERT